MTFVLGSKSMLKLKGVHPDLVKVLLLAIKLTPVDFTVIEGVRTPARQKELFAVGRTGPRKSEKKITWSMNSRHLTGHAVDIGPFDAKGNILWADHKPFLTMGKAVFTAAACLSIPVRWGYDWDGDKITMEAGEYDGPHFELARNKYP